jgi:hypothetical protein
LEFGWRALSADIDVQVSAALQQGLAYKAGVMSQLAASCLSKVERESYLKMQHSHKIFSDLFQAQEQVGRLGQKDEEKCVNNIHPAFKCDERSLKQSPWIWKLVENDDARRS